MLVGLAGKLTRKTTLAVVESRGIGAATVKRKLVIPMLCGLSA